MNPDERNEEPVAIGTVWDCTPVAWEAGERPPGWPDGWEPYYVGIVPMPGYVYVGTAEANL